MVAPKFSVLALLFLCSCAQSQPQQTVKLEGIVDKCFTVGSITLDTTKEPVLATVLIASKVATVDCPCKSAVMKYNAFQEKDGNSFSLISGQFSALGKENVVLPIAVQKQLIFPDVPIRVALSCSNS